MMRKNKLFMITEFQTVNTLFKLAGELLRNFQRWELKHRGSQKGV